MNSQSWLAKNIFLTEDDQVIEYDFNSIRTGRSYKFGQLKLLLSEVLFIVNHWQRQYDKIHIVCAGAVTGEHFQCLAQMFDCVERIDLWDPKFDLSLNRPGKNEKNSKIHFYQDYLTASSAATYRNTKNIFFISDIRCYGASSGELKFRKEYLLDTRVEVSRHDIERLINDENKFQIKSGDKQWEQIQLAGPHAKTIQLELTGEQLDYVRFKWVTALSKEDYKKSRIYIDKLIVEDHIIQQEIVEAMQPREAMLKFRPPFDWDNNPKDVFKYYSGYIYKQAFAASGSAETRLVPILWDGPNWAPQYRNYSLQSYERKLTYYNNRIRDDIGIPKQLWKSPIDQSTEINDGNRLINSFDTCYMLYVLDKYMWFTYPADQQPTDRKLRQTIAMALWNWIYDTIIHFSLYNSIDLSAKREKVIRNATRRAVTLETIDDASELITATQPSVYHPPSSEGYTPEGTVTELKIPQTFTEYTFGNVDIDPSLLEGELF